MGGAGTSRFLAYRPVVRKERSIMFMAQSPTMAPAAATAIKPTIRAGMSLLIGIWENFAIGLLAAMR
jgi:hypothetical protein